MTSVEPAPPALAEIRLGAVDADRTETGDACDHYVPSIVNDYGSRCENCMCNPEEHRPCRRFVRPSIETQTTSDKHIDGRKS